MSSSHPSGTIALADQLSKKSIRLIDAPVSGGQKSCHWDTDDNDGEKEDLHEIKKLMDALAT